jgi:hypothetical protein
MLSDIFDLGPGVFVWGDGLFEGFLWGAASIL